MRRAIFVQVLAAVFLVSGSLVAQDNADGDNEKAKAAAAYSEGKTAFGAGQFKAALEKFTEAYNLSGKVDLLCNLAVCSEKLGKPKKARAYYDLYLEENPEVKDAPAACEKIVQRKDLEDPALLPPAQTEAPAETEAPAQTETEDDWPPATSKPQPEMESVVAKEKDDKKPIGPGLMIGVGGLVLVSGGLTAIAAYKKHRDLEISCSPDCTDGQVSSAKKVAVTADVLLGVGVVTAAAGVIWLLLSSNKEKEGADVAASRVRAVPIAGREGGGMMIEGSF